MEIKSSFFGLLETVPSGKGVHYQLTTKACNALLIAGITGVASILGKMVLDVKIGMPLNTKAVAFLVTAATATILGLFCRIYRHTLSHNGLAPNKQAAEAYLKGNRSIVPGSYVFYDETFINENGQEEGAKIRTGDIQNHKKTAELHLDKDHDFDISHSRSEDVYYLAPGEIIEGKPWEKHLHYLDAIEIFRRECPPDYCWMKVLMNGKIVYMYQTKEESDFSNTYCIKCTPYKDILKDAPEYLPFSQSSQSFAPFLTNPNVAEALLLDKKSKRLPVNAYLPIYLYDSVSKTWEFGVCWKEKNITNYSKDFPEGKTLDDYFLYEFSNEDFIRVTTSFSYKTS
jgi:hypothetical protein